MHLSSNYTHVSVVRRTDTSHSVVSLVASTRGKSSYPARSLRTALMSRTDLRSQLVKAPFNGCHIIPQSRPQYQHPTEHRIKTIILRDIGVGDVVSRDLLGVQVVSFPHPVSIFFLPFGECPVRIFVEFGQEVVDV